jgi:hypothetical protein
MKIRFPKPTKSAKRLRTEIRWRRWRWRKVQPKLP